MLLALEVFRCLPQPLRHRYRLIGFTINGDGYDSTGSDKSVAVFFKNRELESETGVCDIAYPGVDVQDLFKKCSVFVLAKSLHIVEVDALCPNGVVAVSDRLEIFGERHIKIGEIMAEEHVALHIGFDEAHLNGSQEFEMFFHISTSCRYLFMMNMADSFRHCNFLAQTKKREIGLLDMQKTMQNLQAHIRALTVEIGERSVSLPENLVRTATYIASFYKDLGLQVQMEPYIFRKLPVANVIAEVKLSERPSMRYLLGAHYDSARGTVGADDNASAIAVQLETARALRDLKVQGDLDLAVKCVSFALEEPPAFLTRYRGSRVHARGVKRAKEQIDGMLCLEMVGYACHRSGCQHYPFPLMSMNYPKQGDFIGIVGNFSSRKFTRRLYEAFQKNPELPVVKLTVPFGGWLMPSVRRSDHTSFWEKGYKAVMITDTAFYRNPNYHLASDTMDKLDFAFMAELVESLLIFFRSHAGAWERGN